MPMLIAFNKPFGVLCQFTGARPNLSDFIDVPGVYPAGRLDKDSEGLLLLTDDGRLQARIAAPKFARPKAYQVLVERQPDSRALERLRNGVNLNDGPTRPAEVRCIAAPVDLWPREPPVRYRRNVIDAWLDIVLREGRNRQIRRMTAAVGHPTLRLIRRSVGNRRLGDLQPGQWRFLGARQAPAANG